MRAFATATLADLNLSEKCIKVDDCSNLVPKWVLALSRQDLSDNRDFKAGIKWNIPASFWRNFDEEASPPVDKKSWEEETWPATSEMAFLKLQVSLICVLRLTGL